MSEKTISAEEFMQQRQGRKRVSKLEPFKADILKLKNNGFTQEQILEFLALNHVQVGLTTLNSFIRSRSDQPSSHGSGMYLKEEEIKPETPKTEQKDAYVPPSWATQKSLDELI